MVGPIPPGTNSFVFTSPSPDPSRIPPSELVGVTVILLTASYQDKEFVRVGYYVNTEYDDPELRKLYADEATEDMIKQRPDPPVVEKLVRNVLAEKPRVTRFKIPWSVPSLRHLNHISPLTYRPNQTGTPPSSRLPNPSNHTTLRHNRHRVCPRPVSRPRPSNLPRWTTPLLRLGDFTPAWAYLRLPRRSLLRRFDEGLDEEQRLCARRKRGPFGCFTLLLLFGIASQRQSAPRSSETASSTSRSAAFTRSDDRV